MESKCKTCGIRKKYMDTAWQLNKKEKPTQEDRYLVKLKTGYVLTAKWNFWGMKGDWFSDDDDIILLTNVLKWMQIPK